MSAAWFTGLVVVAVVTHQVRASGPNHGWPDVVSVFAGSFALFALFGVAFYQLEAVRFERLMRGEEVIARWTVSESDWRHFAMEESARNAQKAASPNSIELNPRTASHGVDVIIGKNALSVGGDFHSLPRASLSWISGPSWVRGYPPCLEFTVSSLNDSDTTRTLTLRFPVAPGAHSDAEAVRAHYLTRAPELSAERDPRRMRGIGIGITIGGAIALVFGLLAFNSNINPSLLIVLLVAGVLITPAGLVVAIVWHRRMPGRYGKYPH